MHTLGSNVPQVIALRTTKELPDSRKQVILTKRIIPASLMLFPPFDPNNNISRIYARNDEKEIVGLLEFVWSDGIATSRLRRDEQ
jgi:hypothetical protein